METFNDLIADNKRKTGLLCLAFVILLATLGALLPAALVGGFDPTISTAGVIFACVLASISILVSYFGGAQLIMTSSGAVELPPGQDPELRNVVEELSIAAGTPPPKIYLIEDSALNAFATGRDPDHAAVAITTGLREKLNRDELQAVLAHEVGHIVNFDIRLTMIIAVLAGGVVLLCDGFWRMLRHSGSIRTRRDSRGNSGPTLLIFLVVAIVLAIIAPIVAKLLQLSISRQREFLADATAVRLTRNPEPLTTALLKLTQDTEPLEAANRATEHLYIVSPTRKLTEANRSSIWSTHPPIMERIRRIRQLTY